MVKAINNTVEFDTEIRENKICAVDFFATWCMPCKMMAPIFDSLSSEYENVTFLKIDIDKNQELVQRYSIMSVPTFMFFTNGDVAKMKIGGMPKTEIKSLIEEIEANA